MFKNEFELASYIDHTNLKPDVLDSEIKQLCEEAKKYQFKMVAINQVVTKYAKSILKDTKVNVGAAICFPLGQTTIESKVFETEDAIKNGADEIDYVINISKAKMGDFEYLESEMQQINAVCQANNVTCKVIFEICYLSDAEVVKLSEISKAVGVDYIKTSTGFGPSGADVRVVKLMSDTVGSSVKVKAAGGIRDLTTFKAMLTAGASRIGTSSGIAIVEEYLKNK